MTEHKPPTEETQNKTRIRIILLLLIAGPILIIFAATPSSFADFSSLFTLTTGAILLGIFVLYGLTIAMLNL